MKNLQDKIILVCGGATGIGAETVRRLSVAGARVALGDLNLEAAQQTANDCEGEVATFHYDQADEASINALVEQAVAGAELAEYHQDAASSRVPQTRP